jgi:predicted acyltransferase
MDESVVVKIGIKTRNKCQSPDHNLWSISHYYIISAICAVLVIVAVVGLQARWVTGTVIVCAFLGLGLLYTMRSATAASEELIKKMLSWGLFWLALGLCLEPFEGGIKKDVSTFSYYFVTTGISLFILVILMVVIDWFGRQKWVPLLVENGQNPMIAYVGMMNLVYPVLGLTGLDVIIQSFTGEPWIGFLRGLVYTIILAWIVAIFTRKGIFWKT